MATTIGKVAGAAILATSLCGILLVSLIAVAALRLEARQASLTANSATMGDLARLQDAMQQWVLLGDLVYGSGETYLIEGAHAQGAHIGKVLQQVAQSPLARDAQSKMAALNTQLSSADQLLNMAAAAPSGKHGSLSTLVESWDEKAGAAVGLYEQVRDVVERASVAANEQYLAMRRQVIIAGTVGGLLYLLLVASLWHFLRRSLVKPLLRMSAAAEQALATGEHVDVVEEGPEEIRRVAQSANRLTHLLEEKVQARTAELHAEVATRRVAEIEAAQARDRAESASLAKSRFIANMSHELRTPLNGVLGMTELIQTTPLTEVQRSYATRIEQAATTLLGLIGDILDFSRMEAGAMRTQVGRFDLRNLVSENAELQRAQAAAKGLALTVQCAPTLGQYYQGDALRLQQVLNNLLGNAIKFTERGSVTVLVAPVAAADGHSLLRFEVRDTGIGVAVNKQAQIFDSFVQGDDSSTRRYGGAGLGLAICRQLVSLMGGRIGVASQPGSGSTFWFELPMQAAAVEPHSAPATASVVPPVVTQSKQVLVVEDHAVNREVLCAMLTTLGYQTSVATNGEEALAQFQHHRFDVILMDCQMPVMDGLAATRMIRELETQQRRPRTRIIAVTANVMPGDALACKEAGMDEFLSKPYTLKTLRDVMSATVVVAV